MQTFTSANTSINKTKVPAIYRHPLAPLFLKDAYVLDFGAGKYDTGIDFAESEYGATVFPYDPYNRTEAENIEALDTCGSWYDIAICSNVLNVIDSADARREVVQTMSEHADRLWFTVYEGDRSGVGRRTGTDQWQNNAPIKFYRDELPEMLGADWDVQLVRNSIICNRIGG